MEQDIIRVVSARDESKRSRNLVTAGHAIGLASIVIGAIGFFGYSWFEQRMTKRMEETVARQVEAMKPRMLSEAKARAEEMLNNDVATVVTTVVNSTADRWAMRMREVTQRRVDDALAKVEHDVKERYSTITATHERPWLVSTDPVILSSQARYSSVGLPSLTGATHSAVLGQVEGSSLRVLDAETGFGLDGRPSRLVGATNIFGTRDATLTDEIVGMPQCDAVHAEVNVASGRSIFTCKGGDPAPLSIRDLGGVVQISTPQ
ncbi:MAG: hypothetical protein ACKV22_31265 [Bryobacteraceae bacterium]